MIENRANDDNIHIKWKLDWSGLDWSGKISTENIFLGNVLQRLAKTIKTGKRQTFIHTHTYTYTHPFGVCGYINTYGWSLIITIPQSTIYRCTDVCTYVDMYVKHIHIHTHKLSVMYCVDNGNEIRATVEK